MTKFLFRAPESPSAYERLKSWALRNHYSLSGNASGGRFERLPVPGRRVDLGAVFIRAVTGEYSIHMSEVALVSDQDLPRGYFRDGLLEAGFLEVHSID